MNRKNNKSMKAGTRKAVESSFNLAQQKRRGTWEGINKRERENMEKWEDISRADFSETVKKISRPAESEQ